MKKHKEEKEDIVPEENVNEEQSLEVKEKKEENIEIPSIVEKILSVTKILDELDKYFNDLSSFQSKVDEELSDLLHYIENNDLTPKQANKMVKVLKEKRIERRSLCNDYEIKKVYNENKGKIIFENQREFFLNSIMKKTKELNSEYRNRQYTNEDLESVLK